MCGPMTTCAAVLDLTQLTGSQPCSMPAPDAQPDTQLLDIPRRSQVLQCDACAVVRMDVLPLLQHSADNTGQPDHAVALKTAAVTQATGFWTNVVTPFRRSVPLLPQHTCHRTGLWFGPYSLLPRPCQVISAARHWQTHCR